MALHFDLAWLAAVVLLATRVAGATVLIPVLGPVQLPGVARVLLAFALGAAFISGLGGISNTGAAAAVGSSGALVVAMAMELVIGASIGFGFLASYAATQVAGRVLDTQMGFSAASVFNPGLRAVSPLVGTLLGMLAVMEFLALDGHLLLFKVLAASARLMPPGVVVAQDAFPWDALIRHSGTMFTFGLTLAAPVMFSLLLADVAVALFSRSVPQLNAFVLGFAVKVLLGLAGLAASVRLSQAVFERLFGTTLQYWELFEPHTH